MLKNYMIFGTFWKLCMLSLSIGKQCALGEKLTTDAVKIFHPTLFDFQGLQSASQFQVKSSIIGERTEFDQWIEITSDRLHKNTKTEVADVLSTGKPDL